MQIDQYLEQLQSEFDKQQDGGRSKSAVSTGRLMHGELLSRGQVYTTVWQSEQAPVVPSKA